ncbi:hypothetical protein [Alistipes indistinctus]|uniref:Nmad2 family putative nucleotide modification protein n=1 Tax=Alistipes indistinctus TaxID=626932 RepID=UPI003AB28D08
MKNKRSKLYSYKMTDGSGFAPNPYHGILTLATCKPRMRHNTQVGNWVAGFTSARCGNTPVGQEKLIYLMKVTEKLTFDEYWEQHPEKHNDPEANHDDPHWCGDNVYRPLGNGEYEQMKNDHHDEKNKAHDLGSKQVLLSEEFYYFGKDNALELPSKIRPNVPKVQSSYGMITYDIEALIEYVRQQQPKLSAKR